MTNQNLKPNRSEQMEHGKEMILTDMYDSLHIQTEQVLSALEDAMKETDSYERIRILHDEIGNYHSSLTHAQILLKDAMVRLEEESARPIMGNNNENIDYDNALPAVLKLLERSREDLTDVSGFLMDSDCYYLRKLGLVYSFLSGFSLIIGESALQAMIDDECPEEASGKLLIAASINTLNAYSILNQLRNEYADSHGNRSES